MRILLVAEGPVFRLGFRALVERTDDMVLVGEVADSRSALAAVAQEQPDVVAIEIDLAGLSGVDVARAIIRQRPELRILLLAARRRERDLVDGFAAGALGFALSTDPVDAMREAIRIVGAGGRYVSKRLGDPPPDAMLRRGTARRPGRPGDLLDILSTREREVFHLVLKGWRNRDIARELGVSMKTVDTHRTHINRKLHCCGAADLIRFAASNGLLDQPPPAPSNDILNLESAS